MCIIVFVLCLYLCGGEVDGDGFQLTFSSIPRGVRRKAHSIATQAAGSFVLYSNCISIVLYVIYIVLKLYFYSFVFYLYCTRIVFLFLFVVCPNFNCSVFTLCLWPRRKASNLHHCIALIL